MYTIKRHKLSWKQWRIHGELINHRFLADAVLFPGGIVHFYGIHITCLSARGPRYSACLSSEQVNISLSCPKTCLHGQSLCSADCSSYVKTSEGTHRGRCNCRISSTRIRHPKEVGSLSRSVAVFFGRMLNQFSTRVGRGCGRLAELSNEASHEVRWAR